MQQFKIISTLLLILALLVAGRSVLVICEDDHDGGVIIHLECMHHHHEHVVAHLSPREERSPHHHHRHMVLGLDIVPWLRAALLRCLLVSVVVGVCMALLLSRLRIQHLRSNKYPPWTGYPERVSHIGGIGFCRPMLN